MSVLLWLLRSVTATVRRCLTIALYPTLMLSCVRVREYEQGWGYSSLSFLSLFLPWYRTLTCVTA